MGLQAQLTGPSFEKFFLCDLHITSQHLNLVVSKYVCLWSSFFYFLFSLSSIFSPVLCFWMSGLLNLFLLLFPSILVMETFPNFYSSKKIEEQSVQIAVCFTLGVEQHHPRQCSRKDWSHQMRENFSEHKKRAKGIHLCRPCSAMDVLMESRIKDTSTLEIRDTGESTWWILLWLGSVHHIHIFVIQPTYKEIGVTFLSCQYLQLAFGLWYLPGSSGRSWYSVSITIFWCI